MTSRRPRPFAVLLLWLAAAAGLGWPRYDFAPATPFAGSTWRDPYALSSGGRWLAVNLHAHAKAWGGLTNGHEPPEVVREAYRGLGYDVAVVSDYMKVGDGFRAYEHGLNARKSHRLVLGAGSVFPFDLPWPSVHGLQWVLERLRAPGVVVALNHPALGPGHSPEEVAKLSGFQLVEVVSPYATSVPAWDAALGAGRAAWAIGDDDSHGVGDLAKLGRAFTWVRADSTDEAAVLAALAQGRTVAVKGAPRSSPTLSRFELHDGHLSLGFDGEVGGLRLVGPGGVELHRQPGGALEAWPLPELAYVRAEASTVAGGTLWLNPVVRWNGEALPAPEARVDWAASGVRWTLLLVLSAVAVIALPRRA